MKYPERDLVFIGGGHAHALVIRQLIKQPIPNVRVTLISETRLTPYSGMLPGYLAGHYDFDDIHIDLHRLCQRANVRFIVDRVTNVNLDQKTIQLKNHADIQYDKVSINSGSTPNVTVPGAREYAIGVKPINKFARHWQTLETNIQNGTAQHWAVVGGGAAGIEVTLAMANRMKGQPNFQCSLVTSTNSVLPGYNKRVQRKIVQALAEAGVNVVTNFNVTRVEKNQLHSDSGETIEVDQSLWCTPAVAPSWPCESGLDVDELGFISVNAFFQSTSHEDVFAVGDVSTNTNDPRPKAGVYAVRSAPFLVDSLRDSFAGRSMKPIKLQSDFLSLLSLGNKTAVGQRWPFVFSGAWVWRWKHRIDQKFMRRFSDDLPDMASDMSEPMHCAGCGSKLGPELLSETLNELALDSSAEDAAALPNSDQTIWQSLDGFRAFTDDLYRFGVVATHHAVNDCYAMGVQPTSAQVWANLAFAHPRLARRDFKVLMTGITDALAQHQTTLIGGHSTEGTETHLGMVVNGEGNARWKKSGLQVDDWLILNRPIGSGVLLAGDAQGIATPQSLDALWAHLLTSNRAFFETLLEVEVHAATDVTGFGLIGHLLEMLDKENVRVDLFTEQVPLLDGVLKLIEQGVQSSLLPQLEPLLLRCDVQQTNPNLVKAMLDPQTQGGLLASVPEPIGRELVDAGHCVRVGVVRAADAPTLIVR